MLSLELQLWDRDSLGVKLSRQLLRQSDGQLWENAIIARRQLTESLADCDDQLAEHIIRDDQTMETVSSTKLRESIRNVTLQNKGKKLKRLVWNFNFCTKFITTR